MVGCLGGALLAAGALVPEYFLGETFPHFDFLSSFSYVVIVGVALLWGIVAALCASLVSALAINYFILSPHLAWNFTGVPDLVGFIISFATFATLSTIASLAEGRRQQLVTRQARLEALQAVTAALAGVSTPAEVAAVAIRDGPKALGAGMTIVHLLSADGSWLERVDLEGDPSGDARLALGLNHPACEAARRGASVWIETPTSFFTSNTTLKMRVRARVEARACLPLRAEGRTIGVLEVVFPQPRIFTVDERNFLRTMAGLTGQAMARARQYLLAREHATASEELAGLRSDLVAAVSHELRTPLTAILGLAELLDERWEHISEPRKRERIAQIAQAANRQSRLVEDLLLMSRMEGETMTLDRGPVPLRALIERAAAEVRVSYPGQRILLEGRADSQVVAEPDRAVQILGNLIDNAAKYSPEGSPVAVNWSTDGSTVTVRVRDQGPGIAEQHRGILFTRFGRVPGSRIRAGHVGTGLGLHLSRRLAEAMGGDLDLEMTSVEGSTFRLRLPAPPTSLN
ncbi:MAG TPA: ATP-binding protein [Chloroflexota bacterium]